MDSFGMTNVSIYMQNNDKRSMLGMDKSTSSDNRDISDLMVIYTLDINRTSIFLNNTDIGIA